MEKKAFTKVVHGSRYAQIFFVVFLFVGSAHLCQPRLRFLCFLHFCFQWLCFFSISFFFISVEYFQILLLETSKFFIFLLALYLASRKQYTKTCCNFVKLQHLFTWAFTTGRGGIVVLFYSNKCYSTVTFKVLLN